MKSPWILASIALAASLSACGGKQSPTAHHDAPTDLPERCQHEACINDGVRSFRVDGIRVIVKPEQSPPLLTVNLYVEGGSLFWTEATAGHEALALNVVTDGGPSGMSRLDFHAQLERVAASIAASSDRDFATISLFTPASVVDDTFALLARALQQPALDARQIENSRTQQLTGIRTRMDDADSAARETVQDLAWAGHPYALSPMGTEASVGAADAEALQTALQKLLVRERLTVVFVGQISDSHAKSLVERHLSSLRADPNWREVVNYPEAVRPFHFERSRVEVVDRSTLPTNYILGYFSAPTLGDEDYAATVLATQILRNRLFEEVRTRRNLTYAVSSGLGQRRANIGYLYVTATDPGATLPVMYATIDAMIEEGVSAQDVQNQIRTYLTHYYMDLQSFSAQAALLARWQIFTGDRVEADAFIDQLRRVTPDDVARVLKKYIRNIQFGVVGKPAQIDPALFTSR